MESKFKVGDEVIILCAEYIGIKRGDIAIITEVTSFHGVMAQSRENYISLYFLDEDVLLTKGLTRLERVIYGLKE